MLAADAALGKRRQSASGYRGPSEAAEGELEMLATYTPWGTLQAIPDLPETEFAHDRRQ
jgi:hypothetical protein